eukprot:SAG11_NODE_15166_length_587_cov_0.676230_2_plen_78_part_01
MVASLPFPCGRSHRRATELLHLLAALRADRCFREAQPLAYRLQYTVDGSYGKLKATNLMKALYGFDPATGQEYDFARY